MPLETGAVTVVLATVNAPLSVIKPGAGLALTPELAKMEELSVNEWKEARHRRVICWEDGPTRD